MKTKEMSVLRRLATNTTFKLSEIYEFIAITGIMFTNVEEEINKLIGLGVKDLSQYNSLFSAGLVSLYREPKPIVMEIPHDIAELVDSFLIAHRKGLISYAQSCKTERYDNCDDWLVRNVGQINHELTWSSPRQKS